MYLKDKERDTSESRAQSWQDLCGHEVQGVVLRELGYRNQD